MKIYISLLEIILEEEQASSNPLRFLIGDIRTFSADITSGCNEIDRQKNSKMGDFRKIISKLRRECAKEHTRQTSSRPIEK